MVPGAFEHIPVLLDETLASLAVTPGGRYCDGTLGGAGHAREILRRAGPDGMLIGLDRDPAALARGQAVLAEFGARVILQRASFAELVAILEALELLPVDGILLDLGVSSHQLDTAERGFSFAADGPLDMRMDPDGDDTAAELIARLSAEQLADILRSYGEERHARAIATAIKSAHDRGALHTTGELAALVVAIYRQRQRRRGPKLDRIHPATRTFQALRIAVNDELAALERFLQTFAAALRPGGRVVVISFHSLEDRAVKQRFAQLAHPCTCPPSLPRCACGRRPELRLLNKRAIRPGPSEMGDNPRARSARLRAAERL